MGSDRLTRIAVAAALVAVVLLGATLRFPGLTDLGPRVWDEGNYVLEGYYFYTVFTTFLESARHKLDELEAGDDRWNREAEVARFRDGVKGRFPKFARLTHALFIAVTIALAGYHPWVASAVNTVCGTLSILALFALGRRLYGTGAGLAAALLLAVSGFHVLYSRSGLAEADALLFAILAVHLYARSRDGDGRRGGAIFAAGLFLGLGYTVHNRLILMIALFWLFEAQRWLRRGGPGFRTTLERFALLHGGLFLPLALWELVYYAALMISRPFGVVIYHPTYLEQTVKSLGIAARHGLGYQYYRIEGLLTYPYLAWHLDGLVFCVLLLAGIYHLFRDRGKGDFIAGGWFLFHALYFSATAADTRYLLILLPPAALIAAKAVTAAVRLASSGDRPGQARTVRTVLVVVVFVVAVIASGLARSLQTRSIGDGYREATDYILAQGDPKHISTHQPLSEVYVGVGSVERNPATEEALRALFESGYRYLLVDAFIRHVAMLYWQPLAVHLIRTLEERIEPVFRAPNPYGASIPFAFEANIDFFDTLYLLEPERRDSLAWVEVYDLAEYFGETANIEAENGEVGER